jgi:hypothetical protein
MREEPARLGKKTDVSPLINISDKIEAWLLNHASLCLVICFIALCLLFVALAFALVGVSATESGLQYNHLKGVI